MKREENYVKQVITVTALCLGALLCGCTSAGNLSRQQQAEVSVEDSYEWEIRWDLQVPPPIGQYLGLRNMFLPGGQSIRYYRHIYGIELIFTEDETRNVRFESQADLPVITAGDLVSIEVRSARCLEYQPRDDGVSLGWADDMAFEWRVLTRNGEALMPGTPIRLHNARAGTDLVYCPQAQGIALGWSNECARDQPAWPVD